MELKTYVAVVVCILYLQLYSFETVYVTVLEMSVKENFFTFSIALLLSLRIYRYFSFFVLFKRKLSVKHGYTDKAVYCSYMDTYIYTYVHTLTYCI